MYKVFVKDKPLYLTTDAGFKHCENMAYINKGILLYAIQILEEKDGPEEMLIHHTDLDELWEVFNKIFSMVEAAGGKVVNQNGEILMIKRLGKWDLPKGKIEEGEDPKTAALREVEEECGINGLEVTDELETTYHTYSLVGKRIVKRTYWYEMKYNGNQALVPQTEEDITEVRWVKPEEVEGLLENSYGSIKQLLLEQND